VATPRSGGRRRARQRERHRERGRRHGALLQLGRRRLLHAIAGCVCGTHDVLRVAARGLATRSTLARGCRGRARAASLTTLRALLPRQAVSSTAELDAYLSSQHRGGGSDAENRGQGRRPTRTTQRKTGQTLPAPQAPSTRTAMSHAARHQPVAPRGFALFPADRQV
jgi:hypothetical protein